MKRQSAPCNCRAYTFPHRRCGKCLDLEMLDARFTDPQSQRELDAENLRIFDAEEARAINNDIRLGRI